MSQEGEEIYWWPCPLTCFERKQTIYPKKPDVAEARKMVKVEEITDADRETKNSPYASSSSSVASSSSLSVSSIASSSLEDPASESFIDRLTALVDIVPPTTRHAISRRVSKTAGLIKKGGKLAGNIVWIVTTSALLVGLPLALVLEDEAKIVQHEREVMAQQQGQQVRCPPSLSFFHIRTHLVSCCHLLFPSLSLSLPYSETWLLDNTLTGFSAFALT